MDKDFVMDGNVIELTRYSTKGAPGEKLEKARLLEGLGMEGDFYAKGGERQISLLSVKSRNWMEAQHEKGLCFGRYKENILFDGISADVFRAGDRLKTGEAVLEISSLNKHCHDECPLFNKGQKCILSGQSLFAKVIQGGYVRTGDRILKEEL
jgi:cyclic pyranopterin phosphate synthase